MLNNSLPFSSALFFQYMLASIVFLFFAKILLKKIVPYKILLAGVSFGYIILLFPKSFHILGLITILYLLILILRKFYKYENIFLPMFLLSIPIFLMKIGGAFDFNPNSDFLKLIRIAGLSYMVFKVISLYIDMRRTKDKVSFLDFFNYTAFTPTLLIGPLDRFQRFKKDTENGYSNMNVSMFNKGFNNLLLGLLFKFILAEAIRRLILVYLVDDGSLIYHLSYMYTYLFYLFFDFAGYSLLAISFGNFIGIDVPINFDKPFNAVNPKVFWKKWHKSLGDWLNDYFFKPIFKYFTTKKIGTSIQRQNVALMLTFTLMGFWNGFQLHYIASGMLFGIYSAVHNYYYYRCKKEKKDVVFGKLNPLVVKGISIFIMFNSVAFAIYIFSGKLF